jgi:hypothetical protein
MPAPGNDPAARADAGPECERADPGRHSIAGSEPGGILASSSRTMFLARPQA